MRFPWFRAVFLCGVHPLLAIACTGPTPGPANVGVDVGADGLFAACNSTCDDTNPCTTDGCDSLAKTCTYGSATGPCDDGDACTEGDTCQASVCQPGKAACGGRIPGIGNSPCQLDGDLPQTSGIDLQPWFSKVVIDQPIHLVPFPDGSDRVVIVARKGQLYLVDNVEAAASKHLMLDIAAKVSISGEGGLLSVAFHPKFKQNGKLYLNYTSSGAKFQTIIAEYTAAKADPTVVDPASAKILMTIAQPYANHNGGQIAFDHDGLLHIGMGDGGAGGDPHGYGQDPQSLLGKMLRIDVDKPSGGKAYGIPKDNPFLDDAKFRPEIWALGMRNPWRFSFDRATGKLWAADVGQDKLEEVDIIEGGQNYGWKDMEGTACYSPKTNCAKAGRALPVAEYGRTLGVSITGGHVYRGSALPGLYGAYVFADYGSGRFWSLTQAAGGAWQMTELLDTSYSPVSFGESRDGELYVMQLNGANRIFRIGEATSKPPTGKAFPVLLSQTGCFTDLAKLTPAPGLVPYSVNAPFWSDGAAKQRWLVLPKGSVQAGKPGPIQVPDDDLAAWPMPAGTLIVKHFGVGDGGKTPVETRFMQRTADGWRFHTYRWNEGGTEAELLAGGGTDISRATTVDGQPADVAWHFPTLTQCEGCHKPAGTTESQLLGVATAQLNRLATFGGKPVNQLTVFAQSGMLDKALVPAARKALPDLGETGAAGPPAAGARAWLHANCANCHRPLGPAPTDLDLRQDTALAAMGACKVAPQNGNPWNAKAIVEPGAPADSALWHRLAEAPDSPWFMPPFGVHVVPAAARDQVQAWILGLKSCD